MQITMEFIMQHRTMNGAWTRAQMAALGEPMPPKAGWMLRAIKRNLSQEQVDDFIRYADRQESLKFRRQRRVERKFMAEQAPVLVLPKDPKAATKDEFLSGYEWRRVRMLALKKYGARCQCCGITPAQGAVMNVDHIKPRKLFPELGLDIRNLQVLCGECNHGKGNWDMTDWRLADQSMF